MYAVEAAGVSRRSGEVAVEGLTAINPGEIVGFLGRNGAGTTTTLRMLAGLLHPDEGTVRVFGYDTQARGFAAHGLVGVLPEDAAIRVMGTAWENLLQAAESRYVRPEEASRRGRELFALLGLDDRADEPVRGFSKGMKRRLAIAMSVINDPLLLVLDEPTSGLDIESVVVIRDVIRELNRRGATILLTTHTLEEADALCDRVIILDRGRLVACDTPARLKASVPHNRSRGRRRMHRAWQTRSSASLRSRQFPGTAGGIVSVTRTCPVCWRRLLHTPGGPTERSLPCRRAFRASKRSSSTSPGQIFAQGR